MSIAERNGTGIKQHAEKLRLVDAENVVDAFMPRAILFFQVASGHRDTPLPETLCSDLKNHLIRVFLRHKPLYGTLEEYLYRGVNQFLMRLQVEAFLARPVNELKKITK